MATMRELVASMDRSSSGRDLAPVKARIIAVAERLSTHNTFEESHVYLWSNNLLTNDQQHELELLMQMELGNLPIRFDRKKKPELM
jgi:hypothetical protein